MTGCSSWVELTCRSPEVGPPQLVAMHLLPFLTAERSTGRIRAAVLLRELAGGDRPSMSLQLQPSDGDEPGLLRRCAAIESGLPSTRVTAGSAVEVPLARSGFDGPGLAAATRAFLSEVNPVVMPMAATVDEAARLTAALDLMAAHLAAVASSTVPGPRGGAPVSFLSLRSHAEGFFAAARDPAAARRAFDDRYDAVRDQVVGRTAEVVAQVRGTGPEVSAAARSWSEAVRVAKPAVAADFDAGRVRAPVDAPRPGGGKLDDSAFHRAVRASAGLSTYLAQDPQFLATRLLTSLLYLTFHTTGVSLVQRYFLCHSVSRACETLFEVDAREVLDSIARS